MPTTISHVGTQQVSVETKKVNQEKPVPQSQAFKGKEINDQFVKKYEVEATTGKKWGVGIASTFLPGLGQAINGQWGKGIGYFLGVNALAFAAQFAGFKGKLVGALVAGVGALGLGITSIVDAVKNAKSEVTVVDKDGLTCSTNE